MKKFMLSMLMLGMAITANAGMSSQIGVNVFNPDVSGLDNSTQVSIGGQYLVEKNNGLIYGVGGDINYGLIDYKGSDENLISANLDGKVGYKHCSGVAGYGIVSGIIGEANDNEFAGLGYGIGVSADLINNFMVSLEAKKYDLDVHNAKDFDANTVSLKLGYNY
jgi:hypothetical protein